MMRANPLLTYFAAIPQQTAVAGFGKVSYTEPYEDPPQVF